MAAGLGFGLSVLATRADAANFTGTISQIEMVGTQFALVRINGSSSGTRPACHSGGTSQTAFALDLGTVKGRALLSVATAMQLGARSIEIGGAGTCLNLAGNYGTIEQIERLTVNQ
jgi:hypothetical protein